MKIRFAAVLFALALPLCAQDNTANQAENLFYKAYYLEKGARDFAGAMSLYEQFLAQAPGHKLAGEAAKQQFALLDKTGKTKERDAFRSKYEKLLGNAVAVAGEAPATPVPAADSRPARPAAGEAGARPEMAAQIAELEKQIEKAKAEGNDEEVRRLSQRLERMKQMGAGGRGPGGAPGAGGGRMGGMGALMGGKKLSEMSDEELGTFKEGLGAMEMMMGRMAERMEPEQAKKLETNLEALKKGLEGGKLDDAQKAIDAIRELMPQRRRGGDAGDAGTPGAGRGAPGNRGGGEAGGVERPARGGRGGGNPGGGGGAGGGGGGGGGGR